MANQPGSAMHIHQSVVETKSGRNIFSTKDGEPSEHFTHFIGGQQQYFPDATALVAPYVNSYRRLVAYNSAPVNLEWGVDNRSVGLRVPRSGPEARRVENRATGADANPYLAIASTLAAGWLGMERKAEPRPVATGDAYRKTRDLPKTLLEAIERLEGSQEMAEMLGQEFVQLFATVKRAEHDAFMTVISPWERQHLLLNV